jgi:hypothetical protein
MLSDLNRDFRHALRGLLRAPTVAATVIATLSLAIGADSVIFSGQIRIASLTSIPHPATTFIEAQLFGVTATDPLTFVGVCVVLGIAGLAASMIPALRGCASIRSSPSGGREWIRTWEAGPLKLTT